MAEPKWLQLARGELGTTEIVGNKHNPKVVQYFRDVKHAEIEDDETSWCAAFVGAMLERSGIVSTRMLTARSYLQWGEKVDSPKVGDIVVFTRGNSTWQGHVAFFLYEKDGKIFHLGGNQQNTVNISSTAKSKLLGYRRPKGSTPQAVEKANEFVVDAIKKIGANRNQVSLNEYAVWLGKTLTPENTVLIRGMRDAMTDDTLAKLLTKNYWIPTSAGKFGQAFAAFILDTALEHGPQKTRIMMQQAAEVKADGIIGPKTIAAIKKKGTIPFINAMMQFRVAEFKKQKDWDVQYPDWWARLGKLRDRLTSPQTIVFPEPSAQGDVATNAVIFAGDKVVKIDIPASKEPPAAKPTITEKKMADTSAPAPAPVEYKPWSQSLTIWGTIVTFVSAVLPSLGQLLGWDITAQDVQTVGSGVTEIIQAVGGVIGTVMAVIGRVNAKAPVKFFG